MNYTITFTPFQVNNNAQLITTATVADKTSGTVYFTEDIIIDVTPGMTQADIQQVLIDKTSGFATRVQAIQTAQQFANTTPTL